MYTRIVWDYIENQMGYEMKTEGYRDMHGSVTSNMRPYIGHIIVIAIEHFYLWGKGGAKDAHHLNSEKHLGIPIQTQSTLQRDPAA